MILLNIILAYDNFVDVEKRDNELAKILIENEITDLAKKTVEKEEQLRSTLPSDSHTIHSMIESGMNDKLYKMKRKFEEQIRDLKNQLQRNKKMKKSISNNTEDIDTNPNVQKNSTTVMENTTKKPNLKNPTNRKSQQVTIQEKRTFEDSISDNVEDIKKSSTNNLNPKQKRFHYKKRHSIGKNGKKKAVSNS
jgi:hypothetical protein